LYENKNNRQWLAPKNIKMDSFNGFDPLYGTYQQQFAMTQQNQPTTSFSMQPFQKIQNSFHQQYEVRQVQPGNLHQT
jgi:hypothetical protein